MEFVLLTLFLVGNFISKTYGYIDPGSGSLVIQVLIGALVGVGITLKIYWYKLKEKISRINKKND